MKLVVKGSTLIFILVLLTFSSCVHDPKAKENTGEISVTAKVLCAGYLNDNWSKYFSIQLTVKNNSKVRKSFYTWSSQWQETFITEFDSIEIVGTYSGHKNDDLKINLDQNDSIIFNCIVRVSGSGFKHESFKIGLLYATSWSEYMKIVMPGGFEEVKDYHAREKMIKEYQLKQKIYWSNKIRVRIDEPGYDVLKWRDKSFD